jgi:hypothetical protein
LKQIIGRILRRDLKQSGDLKELNVEMRIKLTLNLLTTTIVAPPSNASKRQMGFNSAFKELKGIKILICGANNKNILISRSISKLTEELSLTVVTKYILQVAFLLSLIFAASLSLIHFDLFYLH